MNRRTFLTLSALSVSTTLWGEKDEICIGSSVVSGSRIVSSIVQKLSVVQSYVGYVQFNIISFDEMIKISRRCKRPFTPLEIGYIESLFYTDPRKYGFYGDRTVSGLGAIIPKKDLIYMDKTGHFLIKGPALEKFKQIKKLVGDDLILTSGTRAPVKQLYLFLKKMEVSRGDLRLASTSIAPPGFTFHSVGDFDIGKVGLGALNFSEKFQETKVFKKLYNEGYISIRYTRNNPFGVRFEPWHIKVVGGYATA